MSAQTLLDNLIFTTTPASLTSEVKIESGPHPDDTKTMRLLSRFALGPHGVERDVMARVLSGNPMNLRFLVEQRIDPGAPSQTRDMWAVTPADQGKPRRLVFVPWEGMPGTELKNFDFVLPFPYVPTLLDPAPAPAGPGPLPPAGCAVVELALEDPGAAPGSDRMRLWIEASAARTIDHRTEHYRGGTLLRVMTSDAWMQLPGTPNWGPLRRVTCNVATGRSTTMTVTSADPSPIKADIFMPVTLPSTTW